jgi:AcrR family transcriptional regulator
VTARKRKEADGTAGEGDVRERILGAAFAAFLEHGFAGASTLDIATRARVSKRELYSHFKSKAALFAAGIAERTRDMRFPLALPDVSSRIALAATLRAMGISLLSGVTDDDVLAVYRLAIAEAHRSPELGKALDDNGRNAIRRALAAFLRTAQAKGLVAAGDPGEMGYLFSSLLLSDIQLRMVLGVARRPTPKEIERRADCATATFMALYAARSDDN